MSIALHTKTCDPYTNIFSAIHFTYLILYDVFNLILSSTIFIRCRRLFEFVFYPFSDYPLYINIL